MKIGDKVRILELLNAEQKTLTGVIVASWDDDSDCMNHPTRYFMVRTSGGNLHDCVEDELELIAT